MCNLKKLTEICSFYDRLIKKLGVLGNDKFHSRSSSNGRRNKKYRKITDSIF